MSKKLNVSQEDATSKNSIDTVTARRNSIDTLTARRLHSSEMAAAADDISNKSDATVWMMKAKRWKREAAEARRLKKVEGLAYLYIRIKEGLGNSSKT